MVFRGALCRLIGSCRTAFVGDNSHAHLVARRHFAFLTARSNILRLQNALTEVNRCFYAKKASKVKGQQKWKGASHVTIADGVVDLHKIESQMITSENKFEDFVAKHNFSRVSPGMLDEIKVTGSDGITVLLYHVAQVSLKGEQFHVNVMTSDPPDIVSSVSAAITNAGMDLQPTVDGNSIRINLPKQTQDYRDNVSKKIKTESETARIALRKWRRHAMDELKKKRSDVSEDTRKAIERQIDAMTEHFVTRIDASVEKKVKELKSGLSPR